MPEEIAVEVGDTEVIVRETDDGFEVEEADEVPDGPFLRMESRGNFGFAIPLEKLGDGVLDVVDADSTPFGAVWDTSADYADELQKDGAKGHRTTGKLDGHAALRYAGIVDDPNEPL